jgi:hypothetical protein
MITQKRKEAIIKACNLKDDAAYNRFISDYELQYDYWYTGCLPGMETVRNPYSEVHKFHLAYLTP